MVANATLGALEPENQQLVELMQSVNFGRIQNLVVREGRPLMDPPPRVLRDFKPGGENGHRPEARLNDFSLKKEVIELLDHIALLGNTTIHCVEVREGLPLKWTVEEDAA